jgi:hypothetical protein
VGVIDHTTPSKPVKPLQAEIAKTHTLSVTEAMLLDWIIEVFCQVDDFHKTFLPQ